VKLESITRLAITNDGQSVYATQWGGQLTRWDVSKDQYQALGTMSGQSGAFRLSRDERLWIVGGNHRDVQFYEASSGKAIAEFRVQGADFYITNAWMADNRLIFTTDAGLLFDGTAPTK
jgi:hypothetical protein